MLAIGCPKRISTQTHRSCQSKAERKTRERGVNEAFHHAEETKQHPALGYRSGQAPPARKWTFDRVCAMLRNRTVVLSTCHLAWMEGVKLEDNDRTVQMQRKSAKK